MTKQLPRLFVSSFVFSLFLALPTTHIAAQTTTAEASAAPAEQTDTKSVATEEWDITADRIIRYDKPESIVAEGNIVLIKRKKVPPQPAKAAGEEEVTAWHVLLEEEKIEEEVTPEELESELEPVYQVQTTIKADWMAYDVTLNTIKARGNVSVQADDQYIFAEQAEVNLEQETGTFRQATILSDEKDMHLEGRFQDLPHRKRLGHHL